MPECPKCKKTLSSTEIKILFGSKLISARESLLTNSFKCQECNKNTSGSYPECPHPLCENCKITKELKRCKDCNKKNQEECKQKNEVVI